MNSDEIMEPSLSGSQTATKFERRASIPLLDKREQQQQQEAVPAVVVVGPADTAEVLTSRRSLSRERSILLAEQLEVIKKIRFPDLMRAVSLVIFIAGNVFLNTNFVIGVTDSEQFNVDGSVRTAMQIACPLYFYYSGRREAFVPSSEAFFGTMFRRLLTSLAPSIFGLFALVIPAQFWTKPWNVCGFPSDGDYGNFFDAYMQNFGCRGFDWLWIPVASFVLFLLNAPFFSWVRKRYDECLEFNGYLHPIDSNYVLPFSLSFGLFSLFIVLAEPRSGWLIAQAVTYVISIILVMFWKYVHDHRHAWMLQLVAVLPSISMSLFLPSNPNSVMPLCIGFWNLFYVQGFLDQKYHEEFVDYRSRSPWYVVPISSCGIIIAAILGVAVTPLRALFFFAYPFYNIPMNRILLILGSWAWITLIHRWSWTFYMESFPAIGWSGRFQIDHVVHTTFFFHKFAADIILSFWIFPLHLNIHAIYFAVVAMILLWMLVLMGLVHLTFQCCGKRLKDHPALVRLQTRVKP